VVELAPITDTDLVPGAIAAAVGVREVAGEDLMDRLVRHLGHGQVVLPSFRTLPSALKPSHSSRRLRWQQ